MKKEQIILPIICSSYMKTSPVSLKVLFEVFILKIFDGPRGNRELYISETVLYL